MAELQYLKCSKCGETYHNSRIRSNGWCEVCDAKSALYYHYRSRLIAYRPYRSLRRLFLRIYDYLDEIVLPNLRQRILKFNRREDEFYKRQFKKVRDAFAWLRGTFPLVRQEAHKGKIQLVHNQHNFTLKRIQSEHARELEQEREAIHKLLPKLIRINVERANYNPVDYNFRRYQLVTQFDEEMIYRCLQQGNSQREIEYFAEYIAHQVRREMLTINFQRLAEADERARQKEERYMPRIDWSGGANFK